MSFTVSMAITGDAKSGVDAARAMSSAVRGLSIDAKAFEGDWQKMVRNYTASIGDVSKFKLPDVSPPFDPKAFELNRMQWMELTAAARHSVDALAAGASPLRVLAMEGSKVSAVFAAGNGSVTQVLKGVVSLINPLYLGIGLVAAAMVAGVLVARSWAEEYQKVADTAKLAGMRIDELYAMQKVANKGSGGFDLAQGMGEFAMHMREADQAGGHLKDVLEKNGIALRDSKGHARDMQAVFTDVARLVANTANEMDKRKFTELTGLGPEAVKYMEDWAKATQDGTDKLSDAERQALAVKKQFSAIAEENGRAWDDVKTHLQSWFVSFMNIMAQVQVESDTAAAFLRGVFAGSFASIKVLAADMFMAFKQVAQETANATIDLFQAPLDRFTRIINEMRAKFHEAPIAGYDLGKYKTDFIAPSASAGVSAAQAFSDAFNAEYERSQAMFKARREMYQDFSAPQPNGKGIIKGLWDPAKPKKPPKAKKDKNITEDQRWARIIRESTDELKARNEELGKSAGEIETLKKSQELWNQAQNIFGDRLTKDKTLFAEVTAQIKAQAAAYGQLAEKTAEAKAKKESDAKMREQAIKQADDERSAVQSLLSTFIKGIDTSHDFGSALASMFDQAKAKAFDFLDSLIEKILMGEKGTQGGGLLSGIVGMFDNWMTTIMSGNGLYANGAVFANGAQPFAAGGSFTNQIVSQPTYFRFGGNLGVMGEAGPEAIMPLKSGNRVGVRTITGETSLPLTRLSDGSLGIAMPGRAFAAGDVFGQGPDGGRANGTFGDIKINSIVHNYEGVQHSQTAKRMPDGSLNIEMIIGSAVNKHIASGGADGSLMGRYNGLSRRSARYV